MVFDVVGPCRAFIHLGSVWISVFVEIKKRETFLEMVLDRDHFRHHHSGNLGLLENGRTCYEPI